jgi:hypothetical protein
MNSSDIAITTFRQILLLPLTLVSARTGLAEAVHEIAGSLDGQQGWIEEMDHLAYLGSANDKAAYAEFVYFHAYIQDFLYDRRDDGKDDGERPLRLFRRPDPGQLEVRFNVDGKALGEAGTVTVDVDLPIARMNLYFFELGIVILVIEVALEKDPRVKVGDATQPMSLAHAQALQNALRRIYPPYFLDKTINANEVPEYPAGLRWSRGQKVEQLKPNDWIAHVEKHRRNPIDPVWKSILAPLHIEEESTDGAPRWRQIIDERIPSMVFLGVRDATGIARSDFVRLCFLDGPGRCYPYAESFLQNFEQKHCYDRFWDGTAGTRHLFSGYSMVTIGSGDPNEPTDFCHTILPRHFQRHYFQMGLLIQLQFAALLSLSHRISEAVRSKKRDGGAAFRRTMLEIEEAVLAFEQRYWFTQVSNQMQAREIYDFWLDKTGVTKVYSEVRDQVHAANAYLDAREQANQTSAATRLSVIATFGVIVGAALAFLGMNVLVTPEFLSVFGVPKDLSAVHGPGAPGFAEMRRLIAAHAAVFFGVLTLSATLGRLLLARYSDMSAATANPQQGKGGITARLNTDLGIGACVSLFLTIVAALLSRL